MDINEYWCILSAFLALVIMISSVDGDLCEPNPCKNNGICIYADKEINCICEDHLIGPRCETDPCEPNPCKHGGQCETAFNIFSCICYGLYTGDTCETVLDICHNNPCRNEGRCRLLNGHYQCDCKAPYTGENCDQMTKNEDEENNSYETSSPVTVTMNKTILNSTKSEYLEVTTTETILLNITISSLEVSHMTKLTDPTISDKESSSPQTSSLEMTTTNQIKLSSSNPESATENITKEINPNMKISTEIFEGITNITVSKDNDEESSFTQLPSHRTTTMNLVTTSGDMKTIMTRTLGPNVASTTMEQSNMFTKSTASSTTDKNEIPQKQASPKTVAYVCGATLAGLGIFLLVAGIVHFSKRLQTKKRMPSFQNADSTSIGSANSGASLV